jgi:leucyl-tRNA synthetase
MTDANNPYNDSFVRWQINRFKELGKIKFGNEQFTYLRTARHVLTMIEAKVKGQCTGVHRS